MTLIQKITGFALAVLMSLGLIFALTGHQPVNAIVCEDSSGNLVNNATASNCPSGQKYTSKAAACDSLVKLGDETCITDSATDPGDTVIGVATVVINILSLIVGVASVIVIIISGLRFITSGGDSSQTAAARQGIIYAIVGLVVVILAQSIVAFVLTRL